MKKYIFYSIILSMLFLGQVNVALSAGFGVKIKDLCRISGARDNALVGYGLVTGLAGTGDSTRSEATLQSISNILRGFGVNVLASQITSRNAASVMIVATLPPYARPGDKLDVNVTSLGDARSLVGGTLLLTHLAGPDAKVYALAQGAVSVGGFKYDLNGNVVQKNHPTAATLPGGATVEKEVGTTVIDKDGYLNYVLLEPDFTTAQRIVNALNRIYGNVSHAVDAGRIAVKVPEENKNNYVAFLTKVENISVEPDTLAKIIVNERTGTVVSGGDVRISKVSITHGDLKVSIRTEYMVSQPSFVRGIGLDGIQTKVVPDTKIDVIEQDSSIVSLPDDTTISDLVSALNKVKASSRDIITILQAMKRAGALHAQLIIQ